MQRVPLGLSSTLFSREQIERARGVRKLHVVLGHPSDYTLIYMLDHQCIINCIYVGHDIRNALVVLGVCQTCMAGKIVRVPARMSTSAPALLVGEVLFIDLIPYSATTIGGNNWGLVDVGMRSQTYFF